MKILVAIDGSPITPTLLARTIAIAPQGEVVLLTVVESAYFPNVLLPTGDWVAVPGQPNWDMENLMVETAQKLLAKSQEECVSQGVACRSLLERGTPRETICLVAQREEPDMLVIGSRGLGTVERLMLGSVSDYVVHHAPCPVLVVR